MLAETPQNGGYMVAAYVVTTVILGGYWVRLNLKQRENQLREREQPKREREDQPRER
jgi:hypothetical protein